MIKVKSDQRSSTDLPGWLARNYNLYFIRVLNFGQSVEQKDLPWLLFLDGRFDSLQRPYCGH